MVEGSDGNDRLSIFDNKVPDAKSIQMHGNGGNDEIEDVFISTAGRVLTGGPGNDTILGYGGNDNIDGGDGNDTVDGGEGDDQVRGGAGDDVMWGDHYKDPGADLLDGGPGTDTTEEWGIPSDLDRQPRVNVTLDGAANDGRPGEGDNVVGIERINMYVVGDFTGTDGPDQIKIVNPGNEGPSSLTGLGGDDTLVGYDFDDTVDGGAGNDTVEGGRGNDTVTGGPGRDTIYGDATSSHCSWYSCKIPFGNDVIQARDGEVDNIDCGIGTDHGDRRHDRRRGQLRDRRRGGPRRRPAGAVTFDGQAHQAARAREEGPDRGGRVPVGVQGVRRAAARRQEGRQRPRSGHGHGVAEAEARPQGQAPRQAPQQGEANRPRHRHARGQRHADAHAQALAAARPRRGPGPAPRARPGPRAGRRARAGRARRARR